MANLGATDRRVIETILRDPEAVVNSSATELAMQAGTAQSSAVRACQRIGYRDFRTSNSPSRGIWLASNRTISISPTKRASTAPRRPPTFSTEYCAAVATHCSTLLAPSTARSSLEPSSAWLFQPADAPEPGLGVFEKVGAAMSMPNQP
ncbi:hypothetical protein H7H51_07065, partial [Mycolicibacterium farcinogenes]|nr:hypothetical protein [Mycolicibacterium farcinogenes]